MVYVIVIFLTLLFIQHRNFNKTKNLINLDINQSILYKNLNEQYIKFEFLQEEGRLKDSPEIEKFLKRRTEIIRYLDNEMNLDKLIISISNVENEDDKQRFEILKKELQKANFETREFFTDVLGSSMEIMKIKNRKLYNSLQKDLLISSLVLSLGKIKKFNIINNYKKISDFRNDLSKVAL